MSDRSDARSRHTPQTWAVVERLFRGAMEVDRAERASWLAAECADPFVRSETERLLRAHNEAGDFLASLDTKNAARLVDAVARAEPHLEAVGPYRIVRRLARGGSGVVYLARDERLGRSVALKFLSSPLDTYPDARERFLAEARAASRLDHPNIATVHDVGETPDGGLYIAMSYYEGETLAERIARGPLGVDEALDLAVQVARALAAAHAAGIVHRDVKPANVIVTPDGQAKVLDFGIAKIDDGRPTGTGLRLGTVAYMSPEQTRGDPVDPRTDVWSFGALLYETLAGRRPFTGQNDIAVIQSIGHDAPPSLGEQRPELPAAVVDIVARCLARDPSGRFESAAKLLEALQTVRQSRVAGPEPARRNRRSGRLAAIGGIAGLVGLLVVALALATQDSDRPEVARADVERPRLAVLPLTDVGGPGAEDYLADALTDELASRLSALDGLLVISRTSAMQYRDADESTPEIARELGASMLLHGSVEPVGDRVRVTVGLVDGRIEEGLWSDEYEVEPGDLPSVQAEIVEEVAGALGLELSPTELAGLRDERPSVREAYLAYLRGRYFWSERAPESLERARAEFQHAIDLDPAYAEAWAGLADTYWLLATVGTLSPAESARMTRAAAERALEIDGELAEAHSALATVLMSHDWEWEGAARHFERALAANPGYWVARFRYANLLALRGRFDEAIRHARIAADLDPLSSYARAVVGYTLYLARRHDEAISHLEDAARTDPEFFLTHVDLALAYLATGDPDRAVEAAAEASRLSGRFQAAVGVLGHAYGAAGRVGDARTILEELADPPGGRFANPFNLGVVHLGLGEHQRAIDYFAAAASEGAPLAEYLGVDPVFDALRPYPRFQSLLREHGLLASARG